jgi:hypothetical protein
MTKTHTLFLLLIFTCSAGWCSTVITKEEYFDTAGNFQFNKYLSEIDFSELNRLKFHQKQIDSLGFNGREILYEALTTKLFAKDSAEYKVDSFAYLHKKIELGKTFRVIGEWDAYDPILYKAIGSYWLEYVATKAQAIVGSDRDRVFEYDIRKLRDVLISCNYNFTLPPISKYQKFFLEVTEEYAWTHVLSRFWDRSPIYLKLAALIGIIMFFIGLATSFNFLKSKISISKK